MAKSDLDQHFFTMYPYSTNLSAWKPLVPLVDIQFDYISKSSTNLGIPFCKREYEVKSCHEYTEREPSLRNRFYQTLKKKFSRRISSSNRFVYGHKQSLDIRGLNQNKPPYSSLFYIYLAQKFEPLLLTCRMKLLFSAFGAV